MKSLISNLLLLLFFFDLTLSEQFCEPANELYSMLNELENLKNSYVHVLMEIETSQDISRRQKVAFIQALIDGEEDPEQKRSISSIRSYFDAREDVVWNVLRNKLTDLPPAARVVGEKILTVITDESLSPRAIEDKVGAILETTSSEVKVELSRASKAMEAMFTGKKTFAQVAVLQDYFSIVPTFSARN